MKHLLIAGSRTYDNRDELYETLLSRIQRL